MTHALKPARRLLLLSLCALMACIGPKELFDQTFAELRGRCEEFGEKAGATDSCDLSASEAEQGCRDFVDMAEEYDCKREGKSFVDCLQDADLAEFCDGEFVVCSNEIDALGECFGG